MAKNIEVGVGVSRDPDGFLAGSAAAAGALAALDRFTPSLTTVFASGYYDPEEVARGVALHLGECPMIGTSSAGEICTEPVDRSVVVTVLASPYLTAEVNVGQDVSTDWSAAVLSALPRRIGAAHFEDRSKLGRPLFFSHPTSGLAPIFVLAFAPGLTATQNSRSYEIHSFLKKRTLGRIPIVGGLSGTPDLERDNFQIANGRAYRDSLVLAVVETDLLFGAGVAHGFHASDKIATVTRASGHVIHELDGRPAAEVCAELCGISTEELKRERTWFSRVPFGTADGFGGYHLLVPERALDDGSIAFSWMVDTFQAVALMQADESRRAAATRDAVNKAMTIGRVNDPAAILLFSCLLRYRVDDDAPHIEREGTLDISGLAPTSGFLTFGEFGLTDEGLPLYCNQSVVALVIGDDLDEYARRTRLQADTLRTVESTLARRTAELDAIQTAREIKLPADDPESSVHRFEAILADLTGAARATVIIGAEPRWEKRGEREPSNDGPTLTVLPLACADSLLGCVELVQGEDRLRSLEAAAAITDHIAWEINRVRLQKTIEEQAGEIDTSRAVAHEILRAADYDSLIFRISERIRAHVNGEDFSLWMVDDDGSLRREAGTQSVPQRSHLEAVQAAMEARSVYCAEIHSTTVLALPVLAENRITALLALTLPPGLRPGGAELGFLVYLTMPLAMAIEMRRKQRQSAVAREIHHRVKNNLQIIASLLGLQLRRLSEPTARRALEDSMARIMSIAAVHETLCAGTPDRVDARALIHKVATSVVSSLVGDDRQIHVDMVAPDPVELTSPQATNMAIILNELVGNALKHGLKDAVEGRIRVELLAGEDALVLTVADDGAGLPQGFTASPHQGLGLLLVKTMAEGEFRGRFSLEPGARGAVARLTIPRDALRTDVSPIEVET